RPVVVPLVLIAFLIGAVPISAQDISGLGRAGFLRKSGGDLKTVFGYVGQRIRKDIFITYGPIDVPFVLGIREILECRDDDSRAADWRLSVWSQERLRRDEIGIRQVIGVSRPDFRRWAPHPLLWTEANRRGARGEGDVAKILGGGIPAVLDYRSEP